jgi:hypothetical protein
MEQSLWVKEVENPKLKPFNQWRDELYGYWMLYVDTKIINGEKNTIAKYYGTDKMRLYEMYRELHENNKNSSTIGIVQNIRPINPMGDVFRGKLKG